MKKETLGELSLLLSCIFFVTMAIVVKMAAGSFSGMFISVFRFVIGLLLGSLVLALSRTPVKIVQKKILAIRGILGTIAMLNYFTAIQMTGSGRATLLLNTFPIFVALFGALFFHQTISSSKMLSIALCVIGVFLVFYDGSSYSLLGNCIALSAGIVRGFVVHFIKKSAEANHPLVVYMVVCLFGLLLIPFSAHEVVNITTTNFLLLLIIAVISLVAQFFMTYGYRHVDALKGSLISYIAIPLTVFLGFLMGEELHTRFFFGLGLIALGLLVNAEVHKKLGVKA